MITETTTQVWVRVDAKSRRVIAVSDEPLPSVDGKPVFPIAANFSRLDYYIVENNASATYGFVVRAATAAERTAIDAERQAGADIILQRTRKTQANDVQSFYNQLFFNRFKGAGFASLGEVGLAAGYSGTDTNMVTNVKPLAVQIANAANEWKFGVVKPVVSGVLDGSVTVEINDAYRVSTEDALDTFLTDRGFDIGTYHR